MSTVDSKPSKSSFSLSRILKYNLSGQLIGRISTFLINLYLIRYVDGNVLGLINVRLNLLYMTCSFLSTEPLRKVCLNSDFHIQDAVKYSWLSLPLCISIGTVLAVIWRQLPIQDLEIPEVYPVLIACFLLAAALESLAEPFAMASMKSGRHGLFAFAQSALLVVNKLCAIGLLLFGVGPITALTAGQVVGSAAYVIIYYLKYAQLSLTNAIDFSPWFNLSIDFELKRLKLIGTLLFHSVQKQLITDGSAYVMTFTQRLNFTEQAVYDAVERLGSLVARIALRPLEESCAVYFASHFGRTSQVTVPVRLAQLFMAFCRCLITLGTVIAVFSIPYSSLVVSIYGGSLLTNNNGALLLSMYTFYLLVMAVNGIVECFAFASMNSKAIFNHGKFLLVTSIGHLLTNVLLLYLCGAPGFIIANVLNMILRIGYNWRYIKTLKNTERLEFLDVLPDFSFIVSLLAALFVMLLSGLIFASTPGLIHTGAHVAVGGVMFLLVIAYLYQQGELYQRLWEKLD
ncbi:hypothetical protein M3Y94_00956100 [Aphelenchoides besseyi]|nr:hypothetical protein M3Y94_00956100 [Aphelenchoides besseyi]KAI6224768.1 Protein RFT1-like protein [Aphelenchoides besseyi]